MINIIYLYIYIPKIDIEKTFNIIALCLNPGEPHFIFIYKIKNVKLENVCRIFNQPVKKKNTYLLVH